MIEIERKFLVLPNKWPKGHRQIEITQGYLVNSVGLALRVRQKDQQYFLSVKAKIDERSSYDFEYSIPADDAKVMFDEMCIESVIRKTRHEVVYGDLVWEIDEFHDSNLGLVVAEVELPDADLAFDKPPWLSTEVTSDSRYRNAELSRFPYARWNGEPTS